jgi:hypothetical protein
VGPDVFKVLYLEKHTEILCDYALTKLENGSLYGSNDRVRASKNGRLATDIIRQQDGFHYCNMLPCIAGLHPQTPRQFFLATLTNFTALLPQLFDCNYYESRRTLTANRSDCRNTALGAHDLAHSYDL